MPWDWQLNLYPSWRSSRTNSWRSNNSLWSQVLVCAPLYPSFAPYVRMFGQLSSPRTRVSCSVSLPVFLSTRARAIFYPFPAVSVLPLLQSNATCVQSGGHKLKHYCQRSFVQKFPQMCHNYIAKGLTRYSNEGLQYLVHYLFGTDNFSERWNTFCQRCVHFYHVFLIIPYVLIALLLHAVRICVLSTDLLNALLYNLKLILRHFSFSKRSMNH